MVNPSKIFLIFILVMIIPAEIYTRQVLLYSEIDSGIRSNQETGLNTTYDIYSGIDNNLICKNVNLYLGTKAYHSLTKNEFSSWNLNFFTGYKLEHIDVMVTSFFSEDLVDSLSYRLPELYLQYSNFKKNNNQEITLAASFYEVPEFKEFSNFNFNAGFLYQNYFKGFAVNNAITIHNRLFSQLSPGVFLITIDYLFKISFPLKQQSGMNLGFSINHNLSDHEEIIYPVSDLFDDYAFNRKTVFSELTVYFKKLLLKPKITYEHKHYLKTAVEESYQENSFILNLYGDLFFTDNILFYLDGYYQAIKDDEETETGFELYSGIKYQFDLISEYDDK